MTYKIVRWDQPYGVCQQGEGRIIHNGLTLEEAQETLASKVERYVADGYDAANDGETNEDVIADLRKDRKYVFLAGDEGESTSLRIKEEIQ